MEKKKKYAHRQNAKQPNTQPSLIDVFPERLCALMEKHNIGTGELAHALYISPSAVSAYRSGRRTPDLRILSEMCKILNTSADYLLGLSDTPLAQNPPEHSVSDEGLLRLLHSLDTGGQDAVQTLLFRLKISQQNRK